MATPIAHKGIQAGAKVVALTVIDFLMKPELVNAGVGLLPQRADEERRNTSPLIRPEDKPAIWLNEQIMAKYRPEMKKYYYDPTNTRIISNSSGSNTRR